MPNSPPLYLPGEDLLPFTAYQHFQPECFADVLATPMPVKTCDIIEPLDAYLDVPDALPSDLLMSEPTVLPLPPAQSAADRADAELFALSSVLDGDSTALPTPAPAPQHVSVPAPTPVASAKEELDGLMACIAGSVASVSDASSDDAIWFDDAEAEPRSGAKAAEFCEKKLAERRRRNREASSRSYYRRKQRTQQVQNDLSALRARANVLFKKELKLRQENQRLRKQVPWRQLAEFR